MDNKKKVLERHLNDVRKWMRESNIDPDSNFGKEFLKQTKLLFRHDEKIRKIEKND